MTGGNDGRPKPGAWKHITNPEHDNECMMAVYYAMSKEKGGTQLRKVKEASSKVVEGVEYGFVLEIALGPEISNVSFETIKRFVLVKPGGNGMEMLKNEA